MGDESLAEFIETAGSGSPFRVEADFGQGFVRLRSEEAERRQAAHDIRSSEDVVIEALRNARDAHARNIFLATGKEGSLRRIVVIDDGDGVPAFMHQHIFEPRVTSKLDTVRMDRWGVHGRGMALYSISVNCSTARVAASDVGLGAAMEFVSDTAKLGEKADQSTFPRFEMSEAGSVNVRGPRNILRTACEFAIDCADSVTVYVGSAADIAATLYAYAISSTTAATRAFSNETGELAVCKRLGVAADPAHFAEIAASLGLPLSGRTCRRIMDGTIAPVGPITDKVRIVNPHHRASRRRESHGISSDRLTRENRSLQIGKEDLDDFAADVKRAFAELARAYYLEPDVEPDVSVRKDSIRITIPVQML